MAILEWEARFELGMKSFDADHRYLVDLLNQIYDEINNNYDSTHHEVLEAVTEKLIDYANYHFAAEENLMAHYEYPGRLLHREEHIKFCSMVVEFQNELSAGKHDFSLDVVSFLGNWLFDHILTTDFAYSHFIGQHKKSDVQDS
jgi:hemerythrin